MRRMFGARLANNSQLGLISDIHMNFQNSWNKFNDHTCKLYYNEVGGHDLRPTNGCKRKER